MAHKTVITWVCDLCETEQFERFALGGKLTFDQNVKDWQGAVVAGHSTKKELCDSCTTKIAPRLNDLLENLKREQQELSEGKEDDYGEPDDVE